MTFARIFLFGACCAWMMIYTAFADVQLLQHGSGDGRSERSGEPMNISVSIQGANFGSICIDCQNQVQFGNGPDNARSSEVGSTNALLLGEHLPTEAQLVSHPFVNDQQVRWHYLQADQKQNDAHNQREVNLDDQVNQKTFVH